MRIVILSALIVLIAACGGESTDSAERKDGFSKTATSPEDSLFQDVMDEHDVAMAKMGRLAGLRKQFDAKADSVKKVKSAARATLQKEYETLSTELKQAEDKMNQWMQDFSIDSAQGNIAKRIEYLSSEKVKVAKVKEEILSVLDKAETALKD